MFPPDFNELKNNVFPSNKINDSMTSKVKPVTVTLISGPNTGHDCENILTPTVKKQQRKLYLIS